MAAAEDREIQRHSHDSPSEEAAGDGKAHKAPSTQKPSIFRRAWNGMDLNLGMLTMMVKGALPPAISLAAYQGTSFADTFSTLGYLVAIMSLLSFAILPRSKFIQTMLLNVIAICFGAAIILLAIYCSVQARAHTTPVRSPSSNGPSPGASVVKYNSSASAVCAIWLFFNIYFANTLRASRPQLQFPVIAYSIFVNVGLIYAPLFPTMTAGISFAKRLLEAFLTGFAIASGVSLFIFPVTVRMGFLRQASGFISAVQNTLKAQNSYLQTLEKEDMFRKPRGIEDEHTNDKPGKSHKATKPGPTLTPEHKRLRAAIGALGELFGKMHADIPFVKREMAFDKLDSADIDELFKQFQGLLLPLTGMSSAADIFQRIAEKWGWAEPASTLSNEKSAEMESSDRAKSHWNEIMKTLHEPLEAMTEVMHDGLQHALLTLELVSVPKPKKRENAASSNGSQRDVEAEAGVVKPGDRGYAAHIAKRVDEFYDQRESILNVFCRQNGIKMETNPFENIPQTTSALPLESQSLSADPETHKRNKRQLYLILYMEFLLWSTGRAVLSLVQFADRKVEDGTMKKKRFIAPTIKRLKKWALSVLRVEDSSTEHTPDATETGATNIYSGASFQASKDPEHLSPTNAWQRIGNGLRKAGSILGSSESAFGFRVACATLSIGIVAYLKDTSEFFLTQRLVWALIMISIGMTVTAGSGVFGFIGRIAGTFLAMCTSFVIWYIVNGHTAGVIVFLFLFIFVEFYFLLKFPRFLVVALLSMVTQVLIIGYELEVRKVGAKVATSNGQPYYPIYLLAPYRLACVTGGMFVAFFWTFFPYPLTARSQLRKDLGVSLYLLANFYSIVHTTVGLRLTGREGDPTSKQSPGRRLAKARGEVYIKELALLGGLRQHSAFTAWEPNFGGKFPKEQYDAIIQQVQNILNYMMLIAYASNSFVHSPSPSPSPSPEIKASWVEDFARLMSSVNTTSQEITSILALLSASVTNGNPLPPYLKAPQAYKLSARLEELDADILSIKHIAEPGYSAFAVMQIASSLVSDDLGKLIRNVKELVGEVDFSFHVISTSDSSEDALLSGEWGKGKRE